MKLFYYDNKSLNFNKIRLVPLILVFLTITLLSYMYGFLGGRKDKLVNLTHQEKEIILINVKDTSSNFSEDNNLFGMKEAHVRIHTAQGTQYNHAYYNTWRESVYDYAFYQCRYLPKVKTDLEYLNYLSQSYAESPNYIQSLKSMIKREGLKNKFK